jgi:hypothetical protein
MAPATVPPQRPSPPALPRVLLALLPLLLGGCSGTPFGEALSRSFPGPSATPPAATATPSPGDLQTTRQGDAQSTPASPSAGSAVTAGAQSGPVAGAGAGPVAAPAGAGAAATSAAIPKSGGSNTSGTGLAVSAAGAIPAVAPRSAAKAPANPAPYRVTIRLTQADPSAPAEVVTEALRAAGVPFEVETIERMGAGTTAAPAVAPVVPAVPQVRPAPSPR